MSRFAPRSIDDFPNEILLNIFTKGCAPEPDRGPPCFRTLKNFARNARQVSRHWKALVDFLSKAHTSCWIARLRIDVIEILFLPTVRRFLHGIVRFRRQLLTSAGCDLTIVFADMPAEANTPLSHAALRVFLHTMDSVVPYQSQVTGLQLQRSSQQHTVSQFLKLALNHRGTASRLVDLSIEPTWRGYGKQTPVSKLLDLPNIPSVPSSLLPADKPSRLSIPLTLTHFHGLNTIELPSSSWMNGEILLPPAITHLTISFGEADVVQCIPVLYDYLIVQGSLRVRLKLLVIRSASRGNDGISEGVKMEMKEDRWEAQTQILFPALRMLTLFGVIGRHAVAFLKGSIFPSLNDLSLWLVDDVLVAPSISSEQEATDACTEEDLPGDASHNHRAPMLRHLVIYIPWRYTRQTSKCLSYIPNYFLETISIFPEDLEHAYIRDGIRDDGEGQEVEKRKGSKEESKPSLRHALSRMRTRDLVLHLAYPDAQFILEAVNPQLLESCKISCQIASLAAQFVFQPDLRILMPGLTNLELSGEAHHIVHFISHLEADRLEVINFDVMVAPVKYDVEVSNWVEAWIGEGTPPLTKSPLPSVRSVSYKLRGPEIPKLCSVLPNVEELHITILESALPSWYPKPETQLPPQLKDVRDSLGPNGKNGTPFSRIKSLSISCERARDKLMDSSSTEAFLKPNKEEEAYQRACISGLLKDRLASGTLPLVLDEDPTYSYEHHYQTGENLISTVTYSAHFDSGGLSIS